MNRLAGLTFLAALLALPGTAVASVTLHLPVPAPMAAKIFGISLAEPQPHAFAPRSDAVATVAKLSVRSIAVGEGFVHFGQARFGSQRHTPITLALFGMPQRAAALEPLEESTTAPVTSLAGTATTPSPLETPDFAGSVVAGITFRVSVPTAQPPAVSPAFSPVPALLALRAMPVRFAAPPAIGPAFSNALNTPATFANPAPADAVAPPPSGYGSGLYNALVPNSSGLAFQVSAPVRIGNAAFRANIDAAHLQETTPNAFGTMPSQAALTDRIGAGTSFDVRAFGRRVSLDLGTAYEHLTRNDTSALTYTPYVPPAVTVPVPSSAALSGISVPQYVTPNYVDVTRRTLNASAAVPLTRSLSLNVQYNTQYYTGSYSGLGQNIDERKDSYLGNLTYRIPRSSSAIVFSAKQYRYRDAFVPTYNVTQNRADLNFTVKF